MEYIKVCDWMISEKHLSGNTLLIYAMIYGWTKNGGEFYGGVKYITEWLGCTKHTAIDSLKTLCEKNLITARKMEGSNMNSYKAVEMEEHKPKPRAERKKTEHNQAITAQTSGDSFDLDEFVRLNAEKFN